MSLKNAMKFYIRASLKTSSRRKSGSSSDIGIDDLYWIPAFAGMTKRQFKGAFITWLLTLCLLAPQAQASSVSLKKWVDEFSLQNGIRVIAVRRKDVPVFSAYIGVKAGGIDEPAGKSGLAHLLEHMAFKGTPEIGTRDYESEKVVLDKINAIGRDLSQLTTQKAAPQKIAALKSQLMALEKTAKQFRIQDEFSQLYERNGAQGLNASTSKDMTNYYVNLPQNRLELWAWMESERFIHPVMREFYLERDVVMQERRERVDNNAVGNFFERFLEKAFQDDTVKNPYADPTIGHVSDLQSLTTEDLQAFFDQHYTPKNIIISLVGDLPSQKSLKALLEKTFGRLNRADTVSAMPPPFSRTQPVTFTMALPAEPMLMIGYIKPTIPSRDDTAFDVLASAFCDGQSAPLVKSLIYTQQLASDVSCFSGFPGMRLKNLFIILAKPFPGVALETLLAGIDRDVDALKQTPFKKEELEKVRHQVKARLVWSLENNEALAEMLADYELLTGDWRYLLRSVETIDTIDGAELVQLAKTYLNKPQRVVGFLVSTPR